MSKKKFVNPTKVITGTTTRWSYANVWTPKAINGGTPKYSVSLIIPKSDTVTVQKIKAAIKAAYEEGQAKLKGNGKSVPALSVLKTPLRVHQCQFPHTSRHCRFRQTADYRYIRGLQRCLRQSKHQFLCFQQQRQQGHCLRLEQSPENRRRRTSRRQDESRGRFRRH